MKRVSLVLLAILGVVLVTVGAFAAGRSTVDDDPAPIADSSVDAGFARDMSVHHDQAVLMASYTRDNAPTSQIRSLASTITQQQQREVGQMQGWLTAWGLGRTSDDPAMAWMSGHAGHGSDGAMPGMATPAELDRLVNLTAKPLEVRFLQLMIRHHEGGIPMAEYAATRARTSYVRDLAKSMVLDQQQEMDLMLHLLGKRGGSPLPR